MRKSLLVVAACLCVGGCVSTMAGMVGESMGVPLVEKIVSSKLEPNVLVAADASSCEVTKRRWDEAKIGKPFLCAWSSTKGR